MRTIWKGAISFGLVSIGIKLFSATEEKDIRFHQVHRADGGRIGYKRVCKGCDEEVQYADIAKGYDADGGDLVVLEDADFADLPLATSKVIDVVEFVPAAEIDPILYDRAYYLAPDGSANAKAYTLMRYALHVTGQVAVAKVALRQREHLATLRTQGDVLVLQTLLWPDEVRVPEFDFLNEDVELRAAEIEMAETLIDSMNAAFIPEEFTDNYRVALQEVVDAKVEGREVTQPAAVEEAPAMDLIAALQASVERAQAKRDASLALPTPIAAARSAKRRVA